MSLRRPVVATFAATLAATLLAGCAADAPLAPRHATPLAARAEGAAAAAILAMRRATARYHNLQAAIDDGFVFLHGCEVRPGEGPVGIVYVHFGRVLDGVIDPSSPDALIYEPAVAGPPHLVGVEFAVLNTGQPAPEFMGHELEAEDEFGVYGLHAWVWKDNPAGMFAEVNPRVGCGAA